jgi:EAL domain-containing protein (putative c-di-GMP-specific phosphodiesterase class I)
MSETSHSVERPVARWFLESVLDGKRLRRIAISALPFRIGRRPGLGLTLPADSVSKEHAEIYVRDEALRLRDLHSTNGTFVNRDRVEDAALNPGDIIHFADFEFRLARDDEPVAEGRPEDATSTRSLGDAIDLPQHFVGGTQELGELMRGRLVEVVFQPVVQLPSRGVAGYEVLGRGRHPGLPENPSELFRIAQSMGVEADLSRLFRRKAIETLAQRPRMPPLFLNTHPAELGQPDLLESLAELRSVAPQLRLILEIHESALADISSIAALRAGLSSLGVGVAYDDFGTGQARLLELAEVPPHYLKFDLRFVRDIDQAPPSKVRVLTSLVTAAHDLLVQTVAEGIETAAEANVCVKVGFTHAQGFFFGRPVPADQI